MGREANSAKVARLRISGVARREREGRVSLANLETFLAIARCGSVSEAAEFLLVSRAAVSVAVKRLEHQLGVRLLGRGKPKPLSPEGALLFERVDPLFRELEHKLQEPLNIASD